MPLRSAGMLDDAIWRNNHAGVPGLNGDKVLLGRFRGAEAFCIYGRGFS